MCTNQLERGVKLLGRIARQFIDVTNCWVGGRGSGGNFGWIAVRMHAQIKSA